MVLKKAPLIVCGMPRSGTRMCADILNADGRICLQGEIPHPVARPLIDYLVTAQQYYLSRGGDQAQQFIEKGHRPFEAAFAAASSARTITRKNAIYFGHKTPRHEAYFDKYEQMFSHLQAPRYIYCRRDPVAAWRSMRNMPWNSHASVESYIEDLTRSERLLRRMQERAKGRTWVFNLDAFVAHPATTIREMFAFLSLPMPDAERLACLPNKNASALKGSAEVPRPVPDSDVQKILESA